MFLINKLAAFSFKVCNQAKKYHIFIVSFTVSLVFFFPSLKDGSINAGILYTGDNLAYYLPALIKTHAFLSKHHFSAIDYSLFNGSSDFFLNANFFPLHPIVVLHSLLVPFKTITLQTTGRLLVLMLGFHTFLACYFSLKLLTRYFFFEFEMALVVAIGFAFSWYMIAAMGEPPFLFCASVVPWVIYGVFRYIENPTLSLLLRASFPITLDLLGGYVPLGLACIAMSFVFIFLKVVVVEGKQDKTAEQLFIQLLSAFIPFILAFLVTSPYLYAVYKFLQQTTSANATGLFFSAQQLAELPQSIIRIISPHFLVPGPFFEFSVYWGIITIIIFSIFFFSSKAINTLNAPDWKIFKIAGVMYFATVLAIYGEHSAVSSLVYYLVPQIGKMHIYQRFLLPAQLLLMIIVGLMLKALIEARPPLGPKLALLVLVFISFACGFLMTFRSNYALMFGINNYLLFELILGCLFAGLLLIPGKRFIYYGTVILFFLPSLNQMYNFSQGGNGFSEAQKHQVMVLNTEAQSQFITYLRRVTDKSIIKYVDITPIWTKTGIETFPKDFSHLVVKQINLSSYGGTTFYLSALAPYLQRMPIGGAAVQMHPDWQWLKDTGADFLVVTQEDISKDEFLKDLKEQSKPEDLYNLPNNTLVLPLKNYSQEPIENGSKTYPLYDNGYLKIYPASYFSTSLSNNVALNKMAKQSGEETGAPAHLAVDGNTDGNFYHGSVSHTTQDLNAWFDVDLGKIELIDAIKIWNRTDCCSDRLSKYWVFISEHPFLSTETVRDLRSRAQTWGKIGAPAHPMSILNVNGIRGRYVRIQLSGEQPLENSYLNLAEVEVLKKPNADQSNLKTINFKDAGFSTNNANYIRLEFEASAPTTVEYLFWNNPRLKYYLNGKPATVRNYNNLILIDVPAGKNKIEIKYIHWPLIFFWFTYGVFSIGLLLTFIFAFFRRRK